MAANHIATFEECPIVHAQNVISGKWKIIILWELREQKKRFSELQRAIPHVTQSMLTQQLRELEKYGMVHREVYREVPPRVEYSLTEIARDLLPVLEQLDAWGAKYLARNASGHR
ncbi:winged helix-turn-helix transcriptional regulator [Paenibacillus protaetiae]|uniref:Transcriptional regulator n=1 Tax=Paenibacillus protaetiae TaxID=2509456 RepID=A0A4P6F1L4_9BACL|nr:helix-turn-helix domain-containing protein [Paenibacillus protaetiae]QAY66937.1 transcriptional regulator [Paenibacillus protaetiae]